MVYEEALSRRLRSKSFAGRRLGGSEVSSVKGSSEPLLRFRPVRLGTVTLSNTLFDCELDDCIGRAMASSGRSIR